MDAGSEIETRAPLADEISATGERGLTRREMMLGAAAMIGALGGAAPAAGGSPLSGVAKIIDRTSSGPSIFKQRALEDYQENMRPFGGSLSAPIRELLAAVPVHAPYDFDVLIIGSGYGASICAARLARALRPGARLGVLERGKEWVPGTFPDSRTTAVPETRCYLSGPRRNQIHNPIGLFNSGRFDEVSILASNGLGGGSLINANVAIRPDGEMFQNGRWPAALSSRQALDPYYDRAAWELGTGIEPEDCTPKSRRQHEAAQRLASSGATYIPARLTVTRSSSPLPIVNRQGMRQRGCSGCGDCISGCNVGAKNTLAMNYLPLARRHGARIFTRCEADSLEKCDGFYRVHYKFYHDDPDDRHRHTRGAVTARIVVLGAGSLGSTELLMRSRSTTFCFSPTLGSNWSSNGDAIAFVRHVPGGTNTGGHGAYPTELPAVGPTIQTNVYLGGRGGIRKRVLVQEGSIARPYATVLSAVLGDLDLDSTMLLFAMGHDDGAGRIELDERGHATVRWPGLKESAYRTLVREEFDRVAAALGGKYRVLRAFGDNLVTVHPLGGCNMADDPARGVVNDQGQVFDPLAAGCAAGCHVHEGLYVVDASIIPSALGVNPLLTISALAERAAERLVANPHFADLFATT